MIFEATMAHNIKTGVAYRLDQTKYPTVEEIISLIRELKETGAPG